MILNFSIDKINSSMNFVVYRCNVCSFIRGKIISSGFLILLLCGLAGDFFYILMQQNLLFSSATLFRPQLDYRIIGGSSKNMANYLHQLSLQSWGYHVCGASIILPS